MSISWGLWQKSILKEKQSVLRSPTSTPIGRYLPLIAATAVAKVWSVRAYLYAQLEMRIYTIAARWTALLLIFTYWSWSNWKWMTFIIINVKVPSIQIPATVGWRNPNCIETAVQVCQVSKSITWITDVNRFCQCCRSDNWPPLSISPYAVRASTIIEITHGLWQKPRKTLGADRTTWEMPCHTLCSDRAIVSWTGWSVRSIRCLL